MKTIHILALFMFLSLFWMACKEAPGVQNETTAQTGVDSVFVAQQADAIHNIDAYAKIMAEKVQELESSLNASLDNSGASMKEELNKCKAIQEEVETVRQKVNEATPDTWARVKEDFDAMHFNVRMAISKEKVSKERAGEVAN
jgi:ElaB/YqjD/DUF883 family membrane-anchored ribosome-binding protein